MDSQQGGVYPIAQVLATRHAGEKVWNTWGGRACQHGRRAMDKRPLLEDVRVAWLEGEVPVVWGACWL